jgi:integrase
VARRAMRVKRRLGRKTERAFKRIQRRQDRAQGRAAARVVWPEREGADDDSRLQTAGLPADRSDPERPTDRRPAWERVAYAWLAREVDAGQPVDPATLAGEVSVAPGFANRLEALYVLAISTGMRQGELLGLCIPRS